MTQSCDLLDSSSSLRGGRPENSKLLEDTEGLNVPESEGFDVRWESPSLH